MDVDSHPCSHYQVITQMHMAMLPLPQSQDRCRCLCTCFFNHNSQYFQHLTLPLYCSINRPPPHSGLVSYISDFYVFLTNFWCQKVILAYFSSCFLRSVLLSKGLYNKAHILICIIYFQCIYILMKPLSQTRQWPYSLPWNLPYVLL